MARSESAPTLVSGRSSQRREVGAWPMPTAATLPRCSQMPWPSSVRYIEAGMNCAIAEPPLTGASVVLADELPLRHLPAGGGGGFEDQFDLATNRHLVDRS